MSKKIGNLKGEPGKQADTPVIPWPRGGGSGVIVQDEGTNLNSGKIVSAVDFEGAGVSVAMSGMTAVVTIAGGGGGGGVIGQIVSRIGPYTVTAAELGTSQTTVLLEAGVIPSGSLVQPFVFLRETFDGTGLGYAYLFVQIHHGVKIAQFDVNAANAQDPGETVEGAPLSANKASFGLSSDTDAEDLEVWLSTDASALSAGTVEVWVLISSPAS